MRIRLPITPSILRKTRAVLERERLQFDNIMYLSFGDVMVDKMDAPTIAQITIKVSKTDPFRKDISIYVGRTGNDLCPVASLTTYLAARGGEPGPFFRMEDGRPLTRDLCHK